MQRQDPLDILAIAFNSRVATCVDGVLTEFPTFEAYLETRGGTSFRSFGHLQQLLANVATFTALTSTGSIYTWGDARYELCLARKPSEEW